MTGMGAGASMGKFSSTNVVKCWGQQKGEWDWTDGGEALGSTSLMWDLTPGDSGSP